MLKKIIYLFIYLIKISNGGIFIVSVSQNQEIKCEKDYKINLNQLKWEYEIKNGRKYVIALTYQEFSEFEELNFECDFIQLLNNSNFSLNLFSIVLKPSQKILVSKELDLSKVDVRNDTTDTSHPTNGISLSIILKNLRGFNIELAKLIILNSNFNSFSSYSLIAIKNSDIKFYLNGNRLVDETLCNEDYFQKYNITIFKNFEYSS